MRSGAERERHYHRFSAIGYDPQVVPNSCSQWQRLLQSGGSSRAPTSERRAGFSREFIGAGATVDRNKNSAPKRSVRRQCHFVSSRLALFGCVGCSTWRAGVVVLDSERCQGPCRTVRLTWVRGQVCVLCVRACVFAQEPSCRRRHFE